MKNKELKEIKPVYIPEVITYNQENELNLVDLALILVKRKMLVLVIFLIILALGFTAALTHTRKHTFSSSISIGSQLINGEVLVFESPQTVAAKAEYSFIPDILNKYKDANIEDKSKYRIKVSIPSGSDILLQETTGKKSDKDLYLGLLSAVNQAIIQDHVRIYDALKQNYTSQLEAAEYARAQLGNNADNINEAKAIAVNIDTIRSQIANLRPTMEILPPMMSREPVGLGRTMIVLIAAFLGALIAIFTAFMAAFAENVRQRQRESENGDNP